MSNLHFGAENNIDIGCVTVPTTTKKDWDDEKEFEMPKSWHRHLLPSGPWLHPRGAMHGLANGEIRGNAKQMDVFQSV